MKTTLTVTFDHNPDPMTINLDNSRLGSFNVTFPDKSGYIGTMHPTDPAARGSMLAQILDRCLRDYLGVTKPPPGLNYTTTY